MRALFNVNLMKLPLVKAPPIEADILVPTIAVELAPVPCVAVADAPVPALAPGKLNVGADVNPVPASTIVIEASPPLLGCYPSGFARGWNRV